jgi:hypothetical protein
LLQQVQVVRYARAGDLEFLHDFSGCHIPFLQQLEYFPPRWIIQGFKNGVHTSIDSLVI